MHNATGLIVHWISREIGKLYLYAYLQHKIYSWRLQCAALNLSCIAPVMSDPQNPSAVLLPTVYSTHSFHYPQNPQLLLFQDPKCSPRAGFPIYTETVYFPGYNLGWIFLFSLSTLKQNAVKFVINSDTLNRNSQKILSLVSENYMWNLYCCSLQFKVWNWQLTHITHCKTWKFAPENSKDFSYIQGTENVPNTDASK